MAAAAAFARIAARVSQRHGGPFHDGRVLTVTAPVYDDGGSIVSPGMPVERSCMVQVDAVTEAMRSEAGFTDKDVRLLIVGLAGDLNTDATVSVDAGPHAGTYSLQSVALDSFAIYQECRGRPSNAKD